MMPPRSYAEWTQCFDELKRGLNDEDILAFMEKGSLSWSSGVAERFSMQLFEVINFRLDNAAKSFSRKLETSRGDEAPIINALLGLRRELIFLRRLSSLPAIPEDKRTYFSDQIAQYANNTQKSLEDSAKNDRSGRLSSIIRNNRLD